MNIFLRAKHWQLFLLTFGLAFLFQLFFMTDMVFSLRHHTSNVINLYWIKFFPLMMILFIGILFGWFWAIAIGLQNKVPAHVKMKTGKFKAFFFIPLIYILLLCVFLTNMFSGITSGGNQPPDGLPVIFALIVPLHLFAMFCIFYCMYFAAKTFKTVEWQRETKFSDFSAEFFMIWFFPIGVWIIQPLINKVNRPGYQPPAFPHY